MVEPIKLYELIGKIVNFHLNTAYLTWRLTNQLLAQSAKLIKVFSENWSVINFDFVSEMKKSVLQWEIIKSRFNFFCMPYFT